MCLVGCDDDSQGNGVSESHEADEDGADFPCDSDAAGLVAFGPEEVEEEGGTENGGDGYADEDVVGGNADKVVVIFDGQRVKLCNEVLLVNVV